MTAKKAEFERPYSGEHIIEDAGLTAMHRGRAQAVLDDLALLKEQGVAFDPFLEIGAGSTQRSAALINNYPADGVATDISQGSLRDAPFVLSVLDYHCTPLLVCCDAHRLPFLPNSFRFVFVYQALHHFDNPLPVVAECHRILGKGGHFFCNEEPMDSGLRRWLRGSRTLSHPPTRVQRLGARLGLEMVFWDDGAWERSLGITEARFEASLWRQALAPFEIVGVEVNRRLRLQSDLRGSSVGDILANLIGGNVRALCRKADGDAVVGDFRQRMVCVDCGSTRLWHERDECIACESCGRVYPIVDGVTRMLPRDVEATIVP